MDRPTRHGLLLLLWCGTVIAVSLLAWWMVRHVPADPSFWWLR